MDAIFYQPAGVFVDFEMQAIHRADFIGQRTVRQLLQRMVVDIDGGNDLVLLKPVTVFFYQFNLLMQDLDAGFAIGLLEELFRREMRKFAIEREAR